MIADDLTSRAERLLGMLEAARWMEAADLIRDLLTALTLAQRAREDECAKHERTITEFEAASDAVVRLDERLAFAQQEIQRLQQEHAAYRDVHDNCVVEALNESCRTHDEIEARRDGIEEKLAQAEADVTALRGRIQGWVDHLTCRAASLALLPRDLVIEGLASLLTSGTPPETPDANA